jgi:hypothetical protein
MIDFKREQLLTLREAAAMLPGPTSYKTVFEWVSKGYKGIKLEALKLGGRWITSADALQRFAEAITAAETLSVAPGSPRKCGTDDANRRLRDQFGL